jgi:hypothetical protein
LTLLEDYVVAKKQQLLLVKEWSSHSNRRKTLTEEDNAKIIQIRALNQRGRVK